MCPFSLATVRATTLIDMGFEINDYDPCVANKIVNDKQCTITWYVDDLKVSHVDQGVVDEIVQKIIDKFGDLSVTKGKHHTYLGMGITYNEDQTVSISMDEYVEEVIDTFSKEPKITSKAATPALWNLFEGDESSPKLDTRKSSIFHHCVAKLLYVSTRCRLDITLVITF